jgi:uncharacterized protein (TIGR02145 family)
VSQVENQNIPGGDYKSFELKRGETWRDCNDACLNDPNCKAYTYVKPGVQGQNAVCWLKSTVSDPVVDPNCISGVKGNVKAKVSINGQTVGVIGSIINVWPSEIKDSNGNLFLIDRDGNKYKTATIGYQIWMAENLKTTQYSDGNAIPNLANFTDWTYTNTGAYCWYNNDINYKNIYGALYNWMAVDTGKLCPAGWHIPSNDDWIDLQADLSGEQLAGKKLKEKGTAHWLSPNTGATNVTGFTALPAGIRNKLGGFQELGKSTFYWATSDKYQSDPEYGKSGGSYLTYQGTQLGVGGSGPKREGHSVRCLRDY